MRVKVVIFVQNGSVRANVVVFGQKLLYSGKNGCSWAKLDVFRQGGCFMTKRLFSGINSCIWAKLLFLCNSGCIRAKCLYLGKSGFTC